MSVEVCVRNSGVTQALLFDFDDLLCNSAPLHVEATKLAFAKLGIDFEMTPTIAPSIYGRRVPEVIELFFQHLNVFPDKADFLQRRQTEFIRLLREQLQPMRGFAEVIALARSLTLPRALASSGDSAYLHIGIEKLGLQDFFSTVVSGDDVHAGKPDPAIFLLAAERLQVPAAQCVVFEDSQAGVEAARRAGMRVIGVRNPHAPVLQDLADATIVVDHLGCITLDMIG